MFDPILVSLAVMVPDLTILYWFCLIVGGSLLLLSMVGAGDADADADVDADVSGDADVSADAPASADSHGASGHGGAAALATWLSVRFLVYFAAAFGVLGVVLTYLTEAGRGATLMVAVIGGLVVGQGVHQLFRKLRQSSSNSATTVEDYLNKIGRVSIAITYPHKGEIALRVRSNERYIAAVAKHPDTAFAVDEEVAVVGYVAGIAEVVSRAEYEFLTNKD